MNKKLTTADRPFLGGRSYKSPEAIVMEISNEGVLCASTQTTENEEWVEKTLQW